MYRRLLLSMCIVASVFELAGCGPSLLEAAALRAELCGGKNEKGELLGAPELTARADALRNAGLRDRAIGNDWTGSIDLVAATECYSRALQFNPDSYEANLGFAVASIARAHHDPFVEETNWAMHLAAAKRSLGKAYMARQGSYEVIYYLAELSVLEQDYVAAVTYLNALVNAKAKLGPAYALLGYIDELNGSSRTAAEYYRRSFEAGASGRTLRYVYKKAARE